MLFKITGREANLVAKSDRWSGLIVKKDDNQKAAEVIVNLNQSALIAMAGQYQDIIILEVK